MASLPVRRQLTERQREKVRRRDRPPMPLSGYGWLCPNPIPTTDPAAVVCGCQLEKRCPAYLARRNGKGST